jgi:hypothetical protein
MREPTARHAKSPQASPTKGAPGHRKPLNLALTAQSRKRSRDPGDVALRWLLFSTAFSKHVRDFARRCSPPSEQEGEGRILGRSRCRALTGGIQGLEDLIVDRGAGVPQWLEAMLGHVREVEVRRSVAPRVSEIRGRLRSQRITRWEHWFPDRVRRRAFGRKYRVRQRRRIRSARPSFLFLLPRT